MRGTWGFFEILGVFGGFLGSFKRYIEKKEGIYGCFRELRVILGNIWGFCDFKTS
jgi:hypothetical protein